MIPLIDKVKENATAFENKVVKIADQLSIPASWLMFVMWFESKLNSKAVNQTTNATGLIQFMPSTAKQLGTTVQQLKDMSNVQQLDYVYKYLQPMKSKFKSFQDVYLSVFFPAAVGKPDDYVLRTKNLKASTISKANKIFDLDNNDEITVGEIKAKLLNTMPEAVRKVIEVLKKNPVKSATAILTFGVLAYLFFKS